MAIERSLAYQGMSVESDWLSLVAQSEWVQQDEEFLPLTSYSALPASLELAEQQQWAERRAQVSDAVTR